MTYTTLISSTALLPHLDDSDWAIVDCRFTLADEESKEREYEHSHIKGAVYAHLGRDLSGQLILGQTGRHPLPDMRDISNYFSRIGIDDRVQVVAYDDSSGAMAAARLWWLLRWLGHPAVAVLDGGWQDWLNAELPTTSGRQSRLPREFITRLRPVLLASSNDVSSCMDQPGGILIDARAADRFRGENETVDPVAGHIPGAINIHYQRNLDPLGKFLSKADLAKLYQGSTSQSDEGKVIFYCGSGVTACHNLLAYQHAGLGEAKLYAGSWSEWINSKDHPVEVGKSSRMENS